MTHRQNTIHFVLSVVLTILLTQSPAFAAESPPDSANSIGKVVYLKGVVTAEQPDGHSRDLALQGTLIPRDVVVTGADSNVEIMFRDESVLSQGANARIELDDFIYSENTSTSELLFKMGQGTFRYVTGQIVKQNPDSFAIETPTTTIGIRGTEIFATIRENIERIGNLALSSGHTMTVGAQEIAQPGTAVDVDTETGEISTPEPVSPEEAKAIIKAAPQTTQGEVDETDVGVEELKRRAKAIKDLTRRSKEGLGTKKPNYGDLHTITLQEEAGRKADKDKEKAKRAKDSKECGHESSESTEEEAEE